MLGQGSVRVSHVAGVSPHIHGEFHSVPFKLRDDPRSSLAAHAGFGEEEACEQVDAGLLCRHSQVPIRIGIFLFVQNRPAVEPSAAKLNFEHNSEIFHCKLQ